MSIEELLQEIETDAMFARTGHIEARIRRNVARLRAALAAAPAPTASAPPDVAEIVERWENSDGFSACDQAECFEDVYRLAQFFVSTLHLPYTPPAPASAGDNFVTAEDAIIEELKGRMRECAARLRERISEQAVIGTCEYIAADLERWAAS